MAGRLRRYFVFQANAQNLQGALDGLGQGDEVISMVPKPGDPDHALVLVKKGKPTPN